MRSEARSHLEDRVLCDLGKSGESCIDSGILGLTNGKNYRSPRIEREEQLAEVRPVPAQGGTGRECALYS